MANDYTTTGEHYTPVPAITDKFSYTRDIENLRDRFNKGMTALAAYHASADNFLLAAGNAGTLISSADAAPRGRIASITANTDATLLFQDNDGASLTDKWVLGYDDAGDGFIINDAATPAAVFTDNRFSMTGASINIATGDSGATADTGHDDLVLEGATNVGFSLLTPNGDDAQIAFGDVADPTSARIVYDGGANDLRIGSYRTGGELKLYSGDGALAMLIGSDQRVSIGASSFGGALKVDQSSATGGRPVLTLDQGDIDQEFVGARGTSTSANLNRSLVIEASVSTATRAGFLMFNIIDETATGSGGITDGDYFIPFYTLA